MNQNSSVSVVARLRNGRPVNKKLIPGRGKRFVSFAPRLYWLLGPPILLSDRYREFFFRAQSCWTVKRSQFVGYYQFLLHCFLYSPIVYLRRLTFQGPVFPCLCLAVLSLVDLTILISFTPTEHSRTFEVYIYCSPLLDWLQDLIQHFAERDFLRRDPEFFCKYPMFTKELWLIQE